jgi:endonuclease YncB( thermonuclease family)
MLLMIKPFMGYLVQPLLFFTFNSHAHSASNKNITVRGIAVVTDGDTLSVGGQIIRLDGMDAPEWDQKCSDGIKPCGSLATAYLTSLVKGRKITCTIHGRGAYGRAIGQCRAGGKDVGEEMVRAGWAVAYIYDRRTRSYNPGSGPYAAEIPPIASVRGLIS